jgi:5-formaminoimidazole-4-carboxamide-1-beta-D-ribofuranosyl 5'-monophosphate synthetase
LQSEVIAVLFFETLVLSPTPIAVGNDAHVLRESLNVAIAGFLSHIISHNEAIVRHGMA